MRLHEEFKFYEDMWDKGVVESTAPVGASTIRCMYALYEDDDGYVCKVGVYAGDLSVGEMEDLLTEQGMSFVTCWDEYEYTTSNTYNLGDVVEVFDVEDEDIEDVAAIAGKDPEEYKQVGFFESSTEGKLKNTSLTEARSVADIEADIAKLQAELADAKVAEKKASYGGNTPTDVWYWDIYFDPSEKGTWTSIDNDTVFETEDAALDGAYVHLKELEDEGELEYESDDYYVDAVKIPISKVSADVLEWSGLEYLI